jgi:predicted ATP-grasp superfamily ATP-dependent carboligase
VPAAWRGREAFARATALAVEAGRYEVVFGAGEAEVMALSLSRASIDAAIPLATHERVVRALDKAALSETAAEAGITVPRLEPATESAVASASGPTIVKARMHSKAEDGEPPRHDTNLAPAPDLARRVEEMRSSGADVYLQEFVEGQLIAFATVVDRSGDLVARVQQRAERIWPPGAGASTRAETTPIDEELAETIEAFLRSLGWFGLAELQFIVPPSGKPHLIDLNGRFYGSLALALRAGVNLPAICAAVATGRPFERADAVPGIRYQWFAGDAKRALVERREGPLQDLGSCCRYALGAAHSIWATTDPGPGFAYGRTLLLGGCEGK